LDQQIPLDLTFKDEFGRTVPLRSFFKPGKPVILAPVYYRCPMLCTQILNGVVGSLKAVSLNPAQDFEVVAVSFNPKETWQLATAKKANYLEKYQSTGARGDAKAGWHFLTGDEPSIKSLADTVGFHYKYDAVNNQFAHASAIYVITPEGRIARYFYGIEYKPRDFRLGLVEASANKIGSAADQVLLFCYHYDPTTGKYGMAITMVTRALGTATVLLLGGFVFIMLRRERHSHLDAGRSA